MLKNIYEVYQLMSFRYIMSLSYRVTFLCNVFVQTHYTSESPVRFLFYEKVVKWCLKLLSPVKMLSLETRRHPVKIANCKLSFDFNA